MDDDLDGMAAQGAAGEGGSGEQALAQGHEDAQAGGVKEVTGGDGAADLSAAEAVDMLTSASPRGHMHHGQRP